MPVSDLSVLGDLAGACRGHPGFGGRLSAAGLRQSALSSPRRRVAVWAVRLSGQGVAAAVALSVATVADDHRWSIPFLLVAPGSRGHGLGMGLVRRALRHASEAGGHVVTAETLDSWAEAAGFWGAVAARLAAGPP